MLILFTFWWASANATVEASQSLCARLLDTPAAREARAQAVSIIAGGGRLEDGIGYIGLSSGQLIDLLNGQRLTSVRERRLYARLVRDHGSVPTAWAAAREDAWVSAVVDELKARYPAADLKQQSLVPMLRTLNQGFKSGERYSPSFARLREAIEVSDIPKQGRSRIPKVRKVFDWLKFPWPGVLADREDNLRAVEDHLVRAFADLPAVGAVVVTLSPSLLQRINSHSLEPQLPTLGIGDLLEIDPETDEVDAFLGTLGRDENPAEIGSPRDYRRATDGL